jgi:hypothetical protein
MLLLLQFWMIWPFLLWGFLVVVCYAIGYQLLSVINGPIALFNIVNYVNLSMKQNIFYTMVSLGGSVFHGSGGTGRSYDECGMHGMMLLMKRSDPTTPRFPV